MRLGQVHGAGPFARDHLGQIGVFLRVGTMGEDRRGRAVGQALIHGEGLVRGGEHFAHGGAEDIGHVLPAVFFGHIKTGPAAFFHLFKGFLEAFGRIDHAVLQAAAFLVTHGVQRGEDFGGQLACFFKNGGGEIRLQLIIAGGLAFGHLQHVVQNELQVFGGGCVTGHLCSPGRLFMDVGAGLAAGVIRLRLFSGAAGLVHGGNHLFPPF